MRKGMLQALLPIDGAGEPLQTVENGQKAGDPQHLRNPIVSGEHRSAEGSVR